MPLNASHDTLDKPAAGGPAGDPIPAEYLLYAEDNASDAAFFARCLRLANPDTKYVHQENGMETRHFLEERVRHHEALPKVIVLDIKMPGLSGLDVLEYVRSTDELRHLPVVMLSASSEERDLRRAFRHRANAYLTKPERYNHLKGLVKSIVAFWMQMNQVAH